LIGSSISYLQRAALCALVLFVATPACAIAPNAKQIASYEQGTEIERVRLLMVLAKSPEVDQVTYLLKRFPLQGPYAKNRTLFIEGMVLKTKGKYTEAAKNFRAALADDPKLTLVRAELAETLVILQQDDSALHHLRLLAADAPDENTALGIRSFIDRVDSRRPYTISGYVSFAPSTNVNSGSKHEKVYSPALGLSFNTERPKSGLGVASGLNAGYSKRLGDDFKFVAAAGADMRLYQDHTFNSYGFSQSADIRYVFDKGYIGLGAVSSQQLDNENYTPNYVSYGPRLSLSLQPSSKDSLSFGVVHEWREPLHSTTGNSTALMLDGSITHAWDASINASLFGGYDRITTDTKVSSYRSVSGGVSIYKELPRGITATVVGQLGQTDYDGFNALAGVTRKDKKVSASLSLTKRNWNLYGFAPSATYVFTDNFSNINNYDYIGHSFDFRLTRDF
jgi:outer membrane protein